MGTKIAKKVNQWFVRYASEHIVSISEDNDGLYVEVISESDENKTYKVHCDESGLVPVATRCQCEGHEHGYICKHAQAANLYWNHIYKSNVEKAAKASQSQQVTSPAPSSSSYTMSSAVYAKLASLNEAQMTIVEEVKADDEKAVKIAEKIGVPVAEVEAIRAIAKEHKAAMQPKATDVCLPIGPRDTKKDWRKAALNGNKGFSLLKVS
jgi:hypothetical protein